MILIQIERCLTCFEDFNREMAFQIVTKQVHAKQHEKTPITTLEYEINVPVRLLISKICSHRYTLISDGSLE